MITTITTMTTITIAATTTTMTTITLTTDQGKVLGRPELHVTELILWNL